MRSLFAILAAIVLLDAGSASAAIRINDSTYENGVLTVTGQTRPNQEVTLDRKYTTTADGGGHFEFHVKYKPDTCMLDIDTSEDAYSAVVTGCLLGDAVSSTGAAVQK